MIPIGDGAKDSWLKISRRNRDINQFRKSFNFGVSEMDQNKVENRKISRLCRFFVPTITWPTDLQIGCFQLGMKIRTHSYKGLEETMNQNYLYGRKEYYETSRYMYI